METRFMVLAPGGEIDHDLTTIGKYFRVCFKTIEFDKYKTVTRLGGVGRRNLRQQRRWMDGNHAPSVPRR